jgi:large subunit ribosomal protein L22
MEAKAHLKYARISPRKCKIVCDLIRGKDTDLARAILLGTPKAASELMVKLLDSAVANAENNHNMDPDSLYVSETYANPGPIIKRMMPRAHGRGYRINKRTSHITIAVAEREQGE